MQTIVYPKGYKFIHPIFTEFDKLYTALSNNDDRQKQLIPVVECFDESLRCYEDVFNQYGNCQRHLRYSNKGFSSLPKVEYPRKNVIVAFSGGKDSTAVALYYKEKGFNVYLYHVHGLNRFFPYELQSAQQIADYLKMPLIVENVNLSGASLYPDHPLKNIIISNMALQWGIRNNVSVFIAFGDYYTAYLRDVCFENSGNDAKEMWDMYKPIIKQYIPNFKFETPLVNVVDTLERIGKDKDLLALAQSCVMTQRFKGTHMKRVQEKFHIQLLPNRCGVCWKCALEYIYYTDHDVLEYNEEYYKYCMESLQRTLKQETGVKKPLEEVWAHFFFYSMEDSKYFSLHTIKSVI